MSDHTPSAAARLDALGFVGGRAIARKLAADEPLQQIQHLTDTPPPDRKEPTDEERRELARTDRQERLRRRTREHGGNRAARRNWARLR